MLGFPHSATAYVATQPVDFRKSHDGLAAIVRTVLKRDPYSGEIFVFFNKRRDRIKILVWDEGLWMHYKRLERGRFEDVPHRSSRSASHEALSMAQLTMLLEGFDLKFAKKRKHSPRAVRPMTRTAWRWRGDGSRETG